MILASNDIGLSNKKVADFVSLSRNLSYEQLFGTANVQKEYRSTELWPFFLLRIPSLKQPAVQEFLRSANVQSPTAAILLRQFGKRSIANPFELVPAN